MSVEDNDDNGWSLATATTYNGDDDEFGDTTARPNLNGQFKAIPNFTIAVDPKVIPYGSKVEIELKDGTRKVYLAHDTGGDVKSRRASIGRGNVDEQGKPLPIIDFYTPEKDLIAFNDLIGDMVKWRIVT